MRTDYFDDLLPEFVTTVTTQIPEPVTLEMHKKACDNKELSDVLPVLPMLPPKTGNTEIDEAICDIPLAELRALAGDDWPEFQSHPETLEAFTNAVQARRMRESGLRATHYTQRSECGACGPVWLWEGAPDRVTGCPWCFVRVSGKSIPRPPSTNNDH